MALPPYSIAYEKPAIATRTNSVLVDILSHSIIHINVIVAYLLLLADVFNNQSPMPAIATGIVGIGLWRLHHHKNWLTTYFTIMALHTSLKCLDKTAISARETV